MTGPVEPSLGPPEVQVGGYIPFVDLPCERFIGESIAWTILLSTSGPVLCRYIPWLCCPLPFEFNNTVAVSSDIRCEEIGAQYGATLFWTMQAVSIWGLILAIVNIARCTGEIAVGTQEAPEPLQTYIDQIKAGEPVTIDLADFFKKGKKKNKKVSEDVTTTEAPEEDSTDVGELRMNSIMDNITEARALRKKRQSGFLGISIPTLAPIYKGVDEESDICDRDEILHVDGECHHILSQGPCEDTEFVLMDPDTRKGYCAPRLCNPDRIFVFGDQRCHDPYENDICPPGRILFTSSFGSPVCGCPYGTYEEENDLDEDVCEPVLGKLESCEPGQVFWFTSFRAEPECLPDPCKGINAKKGLNELPYVPSIFDGKCYQLGQELIQCPDDTFYTLSYSSLKGICASLEDAGYTVLDEEMLDAFASMYGSRLPRGALSSSLSSHLSSIKRHNFPDIGSSAVVPSYDPKSNNIPLKIGQSVLFGGSSSSSNDDDSSSHSSSSKSQNEESYNVLPTHATAFSPSAISLGSDNPLAKLFYHSRNLPKKNESIEESDENEIKMRRRRDSELPHSSPETVFQSSLASCRAGGKIGINFKCSIKYLPNRLPLSRPKRDIAPIVPFPSCPKGSLYNIKRTCVSRDDEVSRSLIALGLG